MNISIVDVIQAGARKTEIPKPCPFCGEDPPLAVRRFTGTYHSFLVGCENDDCAANPQVSGRTPEEAWKRWNTRSLQSTPLNRGEL